MVGQVKANYPGIFKGTLENAVPPSITIYSPQNSTYASNNITLYLTSEIGSLPQESLFGQIGINEIWVEGDWQTNSTIINPNNIYADFLSHIPLFPVNVTYRLVDIPNGNHTLKITAIESGQAGWNENRAVFYDINVNSSVTVNFTIDTTPPKITILSIGNKTYSSTDMPLKFHINETTSEIYYNLDNNANITINGNITLNNLFYGSHSLAIYANDTVGNLGKTEVSFSVAHPNELLLASIENLLPVIIAVCLVGVAIALTVIYKVRHSKKNPDANK